MCSLSFTAFVKNVFSAFNCSFVPGDKEDVSISAILPNTSIPLIPSLIFHQPDFTPNLKLLGLTLAACVTVKIPFCNLVVIFVGMLKACQ